MLAEIGFISVGFAFLAAIYSIVATAIGGVQRRSRLSRSGRNAALATFPLIALAAICLVIALVSQQYQMAYVWSVTNPGTPLFYRITALWGSQKGSLLFWSALMSGFTFAAIWLNWRRAPHLMSYATAVMMASLVFFLGLTLFLENPFERYWQVAGADGTAEIIASAFIPPNATVPDYQVLASSATGLNPLLRHFGMIIHPPMLYLGFVGFLIPFAFAVAALISGDLSSLWVRLTRRWTLIAWLFLGLGLILGGRWAYDVLGWGGYWGWDPVENAAFLPWLVGTAFLHSVITQEKRGMLKVWNMVLIIITFSAVMFGTFATRSGVIESVHSFARSAIGFPMLAFWGGMTLFSLSLLVWRWRGGYLRDERIMAGWLSREAFFVLNNVIFLALAVLIFWGSFGAPILSELVFDTEITIGTQYFYQVTPPLFIAMYILMGVAPLSAWGATSVRRLGASLLIPLAITLALLLGITLLSRTTMGALVGYGVVLFSGVVALFEIIRGVHARVRTHHDNPLLAFWKLLRRNQQRYGGYLVHLGIAVIGIGVVGSTLFQYETRQSMTLGQTVRIDENYQLRFDSFERGIAADGRMVNTATVTPIQNGVALPALQPRIDEFDTMNMTIAGADSNLERDFYVLMTRGDAGDTATVTFKIYINPLVNLVWWGGILLIIGTVAATYPRQMRELAPEAGERRRATARQRKASA